MTDRSEDSRLAFMAKDLHDVSMKIIGIESILKDLLMIVTMGKDTRLRIMSDIVEIKQTIETVGRQLAMLEHKRGKRESHGEKT